MTVEDINENIKQAYSLSRVLSKKNNGEVLLMKNRQTGQPVVVRKYEKAIPAYNLLKQYHTPNIAGVYDTYEAENGQVVLEEYVEGLTVGQILESGKYTYRGAKKVLAALCEALSFLHANGIIHRDIKPENVIISKSGEIKLIDFNASKIHINTNRTESLVLGTIGYASPEQMGVAEIDCRTDIFAMGILLNVMMTGVHPSEKMATGKAGKIVLKCTQIDPNRRYQTAEELLSAL